MSPDTEPIEITRDTILRGVVGSRVHGLSVADHDDRDEMGVLVEPWHHFYGLRPRFEQYTFRTQPDGARSGPGDLDLVIYSLAKYVKLALAGNPTILTMLFLPDAYLVRQTETGRHLMALAPKLVGNSIYGSYLGYMRQQRHRLTNKVKMPNRPELVAQYGYDTKYAGHLLRLGYQGIEMAETGRLNLPMLDPVRSHIVDVRLGNVSEADVLDEAQGLEAKIEHLRDTSPMPPVDRDAAEAFVLQAYMERHPYGWADRRQYSATGGQ